MPGWPPRKIGASFIQHDIAREFFGNPLIKPGRGLQGAHTAPALALASKRFYAYIMKLHPRRSIALPLVIFSVAAILVVLAFLQVHWSNQVSQAERDRMEARLDTSVERFRRNFYLELLRVCWAFQIESPLLNSKTLAAYADRYEDWQDASAHPDMVTGMFVWKQSPQVTLLRFDPVSSKFVPTPWPAEMAELHEFAEHWSESSGEGQEAGWERPWFVDESVPALIRRLGHYASPESNADRPRPEGGIIIHLNMRFIRRVLLPMLTERYFRGPEGSAYRISIVSGDNPAKMIYQSFAPPPGSPEYRGDEVVELIRDPAEDAIKGRSEEGADARKDESYSNAPFGSPPGAQALRHLRIYPPGGSEAWKLIVRHRSGSVEAAVFGLRRRNLAVSLGVLLLLAISVALIIVSAQRAQRLARLQMDFVAGVSHELHTPLAVICSAAENLADGVVEAKQQVKNYGALIREEGRRLAEMVEQVLVFAAQQGGRQEYQRQPLQMAEVIEAALESVRTTIDSSGAVVEKRLDPALPPVMGNASALARCIQNLISNALKYGGHCPWVCIQARKEETQTGVEVQVDVEDSGAGIEADDLPHIFEPFYRGKDKGQIRGTGLGLNLARDIAEAMKGSLTVRSAPGKGSCFTLHLPAAPLLEQDE